MPTNQVDEKGAGRINIKIRGHGKKRMNPERFTTGTPPPMRPGALLDGKVSAGQPGRAPPQKVTDNRKVSAGQPGRWASRGGIRTGARVSPTEGDNLKDPGIKTAAEG